MKSPRVIEAPKPLVSLAQVKSHLRVSGDDDDDLIKAYVAAAQASIEGPGGCLGYSIAPQLLELTLASEETLCQPDIVLTFGPVVAVDSVTFGADRTVVDPSHYLCVPWTFPHWLLRPGPSLAWPWADTSGVPVAIRYRTGQDVVPPQVVTAIMMLTADLYDTRDAKITADLAENPTIARLLKPLQVVA